MERPDPASFYFDVEQPSLFPLQKNQNVQLIPNTLFWMDECGSYCWNNTFYFSFNLLRLLNVLLVQNTAHFILKRGFWNDKKSKHMSKYGCGSCMLPLGVDFLSGSTPLPFLNHQDSTEPPSQICLIAYTTTCSLWPFWFLFHPANWSQEDLQINILNLHMEY